MSGDHNSVSNSRVLSCHLKDDYSGQDILVVEHIGEKLEHLHEAFRTFALAAGFHPDLVKAYFDEVKGCDAQFVDGK